jgi:hypothetical protein
MRMLCCRCCKYCEETRIRSHIESHWCAKKKQWVNYTCSEGEYVGKRRTCDVNTG